MVTGPTGPVLHGVAVVCGESWTCRKGGAYAGMQACAARATARGQVIWQGQRAMALFGMTLGGRKARPLSRVKHKMSRYIYIYIYMGLLPVNTRV